MSSALSKPRSSCLDVELALPDILTDVEVERVLERLDGGVLPPVGGGLEQKFWSTQARIWGNGAGWRVGWRTSFFRWKRAPIGHFLSNCPFRRR